MLVIKGKNRYTIQLPKEIKPCIGATVVGDYISVIGFIPNTNDFGVKVHLYHPASRQWECVGSQETYLRGLTSYESTLVIHGSSAVYLYEVNTRVWSMFYLPGACSNSVFVL